MNLLTKLLARLPKLNSSSATSHSPHALDSRQISDTIERAFAAAGLDKRHGPARDVRATIDQALSQAGLGLGKVMPAAAERSAVDPANDASAVTEAWHTRREHAPVPPTPAAGGQFVTRSFSGAAGTRSYKLYVPTGYLAASDARAPLLVMLHGCTQSPDDFAAGTRMNALADAHGFFVAYPAQTPRDNGSKCWNWFRSEDQARGRGEPSLIAGIVGAVASDYRIDARRVFVAGLSAGAAMAVILGETYPDVFAAVGAHSGLPFAAAHDMPSAFAAMKSGAGSAGAAKRSGNAPRAQDHVPVPTIVFHGDADHTVTHRNGLAIVRAAAADTSAQAPLRASVHPGAVAGGRTYTREVFADHTAQSIVEHWTVHGAGHAWSGGSASGSYTDPSGPDASAEMVRFFLQQRGGSG